MELNSKEDVKALTEYQKMEKIERIEKKNPSTWSYPKLYVFISDCIWRLGNVVRRAIITF
jgi:hypothetical protein